jgi:hypothetical protein
VIRKVMTAMEAVIGGEVAIEKVTGKRGKESMIVLKMPIGDLHLSLSGIYHMMSGKLFSSYFFQLIIPLFAKI